MSRSGDTTATAGYDARWPIRAHHVAALLAHGPCSRSELAAAARSFLPKGLVEDVLCAMENDRIVIATASTEHLTRGERIALLQEQAGGFAPHIVLSLSMKGRRFVAQHDQRAEAGLCLCEWCLELAEVRAWATERTPEQIYDAWLAISAQIS